MGLLYNNSGIFRAGNMEFTLLTQRFAHGAWYCRPPWDSLWVPFFWVPLFNGSTFNKHTPQALLELSESACFKILDEKSRESGVS